MKRNWLYSVFLQVTLVSVAVPLYYLYVRLNALRFSFQVSIFYIKNINFVGVGVTWQQPAVPVGGRQIKGGVYSRNFNMSCRYFR